MVGCLPPPVSADGIEPSQDMRRVFGLRIGRSGVLSVCPVASGGAFVDSSSVSWESFGPGGESECADVGECAGGCCARRFRARLASPDPL